MSQRRLTRQIVRAHTAFRHVEELLAAMRAGYVPTVSRRRARSLLDALKADCLPVFEVA